MDKRACDSPFHMIDEKKLRIWEQANTLEAQGMPERAQEMAELIRLARLGLWAEKHGIPALEYFSDAKRRTVVLNLPEAMPSETRLMIEADSERADGALAALPKT